MGRQNTLEWQGRVAQGHDESLKMIGDSRITILFALERDGERGGKPRRLSISLTFYVEPGLSHDECHYYELGMISFKVHAST